MSTYSVDWIKTWLGNGTNEGDTITIKSPNAHSIACGVYKNGSLVLMGQGMPNQAEVKIKIQRANMSLKGQAVLKTEIYDKSYRRTEILDAFIIL